MLQRESRGFGEEGEDSTKLNQDLPGEDEQPSWCVDTLLIQGCDFVNVCVVNLSDVPVCLRRHTLLANAVEVDAILDPHGAELGDWAQGPVVYVRGDDFDGHIDAELPLICHVESTENESEIQFFSAESQDGSLDTSVDVKVGPSRDSVSSDGSSLEGTCSHVMAGLPTQ